MNVTREDLVGYLLAALEPHEMRRIDGCLSDSPLLREQLADLQRTIQSVDRQLLGSDRLVELPAGLSEKTLALIDAAGPVPENTVGPENAVASVRLLPKMRPLHEVPQRGRRRLADWVVGGLAGVALLGLGLPTVAQLRDESRKLVCQDHLRQIGEAIHQFVFSDPQERLPGLARNGPRAFAGVYAVQLGDKGFLPNTSWLWCPAGEVPKPRPAVGDSGGWERSGKKPLFPGLTQLVSDEEIRQASEAKDFQKLGLLQQHSGGNRSYNLGVMDGERYSAPRYEGRPTFAVLGDSPIQGVYQGMSVDPSRMQWPHGANGTNLLFEDGSIQHVFPARMHGQIDHPYMNHRGTVEAGVHPDDASLAPSGWPPFLLSRQR